MTETTGRYRITPETDQLAWICPDGSASIAGTPLQHYLELDTRDGAISVGERYSSDNAVPFDVWHRIVRRYHLPLSTDARALTDAINDGEFDSFFARICDGTDVEWDGNNFAGRSSGDARRAEEDLCSQLSHWRYELDSERRFCGVRHT